MKGLLIGLALFSGAALAAGKGEGKIEGKGEKLTQEQALGVVLTANGAEMAYGTAMAGLATDPEVRAFAQRLVKEHGESNQKLLDMMKEGTMRPMRSDAQKKMDEDAARKVADYWSRDAGPDLDKRFLTEAIADHRHDLDDLDNMLIPAARTPEMKEALTTLRSTVANHLQEACTLGQRMGSDTKGCTPSAPGTR